MVPRVHAPGGCPHVPATGATRDVAGDETANGSRYVSHQRLGEVMDQHRTVEIPAIQARYDAIIAGKASIERVERIEADVRDLARAVAEHESLLQQMRGMVSLAKVALGSSVLGIIVSVVAIVSAVR